MQVQTGAPKKYHGIRLLTYLRDLLAPRRSRACTKSHEDQSRSGTPVRQPCQQACWYLTVSKLVLCRHSGYKKKKEKRKKRANQLDWKSTQHMYKIEKCAFNWINILLNFVSAIWQEQIGVNLTYLRACGRGIRPGGGAVNQRFSKLRSKHDKNFLSIYGEVEREG